MARSHRPKPTETELFAQLLGSNTVTSIGNYTIGKTIGEGSFGKVKLGVHKLTGQEVAIKVVDRIHAPTVVREIETWRHLHHPNISQLYEVLVTENRIYMVTELCSGGEAFDYIVAHGKLPDRGAETRRIFRQVVEAVQYCHGKGFVHRDLKLENVLLTSDLTVKVIDFGFTREYNDRNLLDTYCGSVAYSAPEMISGIKYSGPLADIWSLGVILYTLVCGYLPFDDDNDVLLHKKITQLDYELPDFLHSDTKDLITSILKLSPTERLSISSILAHPWFQDPTTPPSSPTSFTSGSSLPSKTPLGSTPEESKLVNILEGLGMDVTSILTSVHSNACDQASGLWYLLLEKHRSGKIGSNMLGAAGMGRSMGSGLSLGDPSPDHLSTSLMESYLSQARRRKSMPLDMNSPLLSSSNLASAGPVSPGVGVGGMGSFILNGGAGGVGAQVGGRRGMLMEVMKSSKGGGGAGGGQRKSFSGMGAGGGGVSSPNSSGSSTPTSSSGSGSSTGSGGVIKFGRRATEVTVQHPTASSFNNNSNNSASSTTSTDPSTPGTGSPLSSSSSRPLEKSTTNLIASKATSRRILEEEEEEEEAPAPRWKPGSNRSSFSSTVAGIPTPSFLIEEVEGGGPSKE
ncbi:hypothetical protein HDV05_007966 [Chytridiales sp. JEL 0842]|nr:hypothetical protein HDV05_007966 [Chytridiales sp. JEL 0842]